MEASQRAVILYENILFTSGGQNLLKKPQEFLEYIMTSPVEESSRQNIKNILTRIRRTTVESLFPAMTFGGQEDAPFTYLCQIYYKY